MSPIFSDKFSWRLPVIASETDQQKLIYKKLVLDKTCSELLFGKSRLHLVLLKNVSRSVKPWQTMIRYHVQQSSESTTSFRNCITHHPLNSCNKSVNKHMCVWLNTPNVIQLSHLCMLPCPTPMVVMVSNRLLPWQQLSQRRHHQSCWCCPKPGFVPMGLDLILVPWQCITDSCMNPRTTCIFR